MMIPPSGGVSSYLSGVDETRTRGLLRDRQAFQPAELTARLQVNGGCSHLPDANNSD